MQVAQFVTTYAVRSPHIMWFLGAGASVSAGIPTAWDMIWDFKRKLYCTEQRISIRQCENLNDPIVRERLQRYFDNKDGYPTENSEDEYAFYFETLYPSPADRRRYIDQLVSQGTPSYGHRVLAALLKMDKARIIWTTNFDKMVEDALNPVLSSSGNLVVANLDNSQEALRAINEERWPILAKVHGDFHSVRLKNTSEELQHQDAELRYALVEACARYGLAVVGYSGRDDSIMKAFEDVLGEKNCFPKGLFWFHRAGSPVLERVANLIDKAKGQGVDAHLIEVETFDELISDLLLLESNLPPEIEEYLNARPTRLSNAKIPSGKESWPVIRFNALQVTSWPTTCRLVTCDVGDSADVRQAIKDADAAVIGLRRKVGVLAFGSDSEVRKAFGDRNITLFDVHPMANERLYYDTQELGLMYEALAMAIKRECPTRVERKRRHYFMIVDESKLEDGLYAPLKKALWQIAGLVPETEIKWAEAIGLHLEYRLGRLWLLMEPTIWLDYPTEETPQEQAREFRRSRLAERFNVKWNGTIEGWAYLLTGGYSKILRTFGVDDGIDAKFEIKATTAFSRQYLG